MSKQGLELDLARVIHCHTITRFSPIRIVTFDDTMAQVSKQCSRLACHLPLRSVEALPHVVLALHVIRTALERIERGAFEAVHTSLLFYVTALSSIAPLCVICQWLDRVTCTISCSSVLGIFVLELIVGSTLTCCACVRRDYSRELRRTVIHRGDYASGTEARNTGGHAEVSGGFPGLRLTVT